jgi:hypothetical protein
VLDSEGYHLDLLVIYLFKRKKTYLRIVTNIQKGTRKMENLEAGSGTLGCLLILRADGCHCFSIFHKAYGSYCSQDTLICPIFTKSSFACMWKECILQTVKMKKKIRDEIW